MISYFLMFRNLARLLQSHGSGYGQERKLRALGHFEWYLLIIRAETLTRQNFILNLPFIGVIQTVIERGLHEEENIDLVLFSLLLTRNLMNKIVKMKCPDPRHQYI